MDEHDAIHYETDDYCSPDLGDEWKIGVWMIPNSRVTNEPKNE